ncbi:MAG: aminotransferase class V-fold PLP-dependent enzyme [Pseudolabrys sp.]
MIPNQRYLFDIPPDVTYLNCAYLSPLLRAVVEAGHIGVDRKLHPWTIDRRDFFNDLEDVRALFARLINAVTDDIAIVPASSYAAAIAGQNLPLRKGQTVIVLGREHFSNVYQWKMRCRTVDAELVMIDAPAEDGWTGRIIDSIDQRTAVVAVPHFHWHDGSLVDVEAVSVAARAVGAALVLDGTQSIGATSFDVTRVKPAFLFCSAYKWLLGPYGIAFLYADPAHQHGVPLEHHSYNRAGASELQSNSGYSDEFMLGARRYDVGERSNFITLPMLKIALRQLLEWQPGNIQQTLAPLVAAINQRASDFGLIAPKPKTGASHFTGLRFPSGIPLTLQSALADANVHVSLRGDAVRVSPYLYNTPADIDHLFDALARALGTAPKAP